MGKKTIKELKPSANSRYKQGYFENAKKYFGKPPIIYRSSYEKKFMITLELNDNVKEWSSENIVIPYLMKEKIDGKFVFKKHEYYTDFTVILKDGRKFIIEIKPKSFIPLNESQILRDPVMYKNACKWKAAMTWCKLNNYIFKIINEEHLKTKIF